MTVNELIAELQKLANADRGHQLVFVRSDSHDWCPRFDKITTHHTTHLGHVVLHGQEWTDAD